MAKVRRGKMVAVVGVRKRRGMMAVVGEKEPEKVAQAAVGSETPIDKVLFSRSLLIPGTC